MGKKRQERISIRENYKDKTDRILAEAAMLTAKAKLLGQVLSFAKILLIVSLFWVTLIMFPSEIKNLVIKALKALIG